MNFIIAALGAVVSRSYVLLLGIFSFQIAQRMALAVAYIITSAALFLVCSLTIRSLIEALRVSMPPLLANVTYFLPSNINLIFSTFVVVRLTHFLWRWTQSNLATFAGVSAGRNSLFNL